MTKVGIGEGRRKQRAEEKETGRYAHHERKNRKG